MPHLTPELFLMVLDGSLPPRTLARALHQHLLAHCAECREEWEAARSRTSLQPAAGSAEPRLPPGEPVAWSPAAREVEGRAEEVRAARRRAQIELRELLRCRPERREERIVHARTRFRSRPFVEALIQHGRKTVRSAPREAAELLALVPLVLLWTPGALGAPWAEALAVRAAAQRANALRVAGELPAAEALFAEVRRRLAAFPQVSPAVFAEVASLEASLRWDQRRFAAAAELLDRAVLVYQDLGEREELARVLIQRAAIQQNLERPDEALADLDRARGLLDPQQQAYLYLFTVVGAVPVLLDLGRYDDAERVLLEAEDAFEEAAEPWWALRLRYLQGRAALGKGELDRAERLLADAREAFLEQELPQDSANVSLDLALVHLHQGRTAEARTLCRQVAAILQSLGVDRDALAALTLLYKATAADAAALAQVTAVRRQLEKVGEGVPAKAAPAEPGRPFGD